MVTNKIILLIGRENLQKDSKLYNSLFSEIKGIQFVFFSDSISYFTRIIYPYVVKIIPKSVRKNPILRSFYLRINEDYHSIILNRIHHNINVSLQKEIPYDISIRVKKLAKRLNKIPIGTEITLIGRSAGAIVATMVSLQHPIHKIISLGYPFKHPDFDEEAYRHEHLLYTKTPMLLIQGLQDVYGGKEIEKKYIFNANTRIVFEDINHDFDLTEENRIRILKNIEQFIFESEN